LRSTRQSDVGLGKAASPLSVRSSLGASKLEETSLGGRLAAGYPGSPLARRSRTTHLLSMAGAPQPLCLAASANLLRSCARRRRRPGRPGSWSPVPRGPNRRSNVESMWPSDTECSADGHLRATPWPLWPMPGYWAKRQRVRPFLRTPAQSWGNRRNPGASAEHDGRAVVRLGAHR
jgi:hypothetical protein